MDQWFFLKCMRKDWSTRSCRPSIGVKGAYCPLQRAVFRRCVLALRNACGKERYCTVVRAHHKLRDQLLEDMKEIEAAGPNEF